MRFALTADNLLDKRYYTDAQVNTDNLPTGTGEDFYGLAGAGRAVYGSVSIYF